MCDGHISMRENNSLFFYPFLFDFFFLLFFAFDPLSDLKNIQDLTLIWLHRPIPRVLSTFLPTQCVRPAFTIYLLTAFLLHTAFSVSNYKQALRGFSKSLKSVLICYKLLQWPSLCLKEQPSDFLHLVAVKRKNRESSVSLCKLFSRAKAKICYTCVS